MIIEPVIFVFEHGEIGHSITEPEHTYSYYSAILPVDLPFIGR